ncbi:MAG: phenylalanine--tRNA ligase subunit beta, partial [Solirubrobacterales bacterium]
DGTNILRTSNLLALRSEASTRFEKQLHPDLTIRALRVASRLLVELCGARLVPGTIDVDARSKRFRSFEVTVRHARIGSLLGMAISLEQVRAYLTRLGFTVAAGGNDADASSTTVTVPPDRHFDVTREVDLIEEVARVHGLDEHLPASLPQRGSAVGRLGRHDALLRRAEDLLRDAGVDEAITWSFVDPSGAGGLPHSGAPVNVHNPLSVEQSAMRTNLIGGLLGAARHNLARGAERVALFESGRVYLATHAPREGGILGGRFAGIRPSPVAEPHRIGAVVVGELKDPSWREPGRPADFYDAKGLVELLCQAAGTLATFGPLGDVHPAGVHPARAAAVEIAGSAVGWVGELHPSVLAELDARSGVAFEIDAEPVLAPGRIAGQGFEDLTTHPALSEDLAVVADRGLDAERIRNCVLEAGGALLRSATVFDVYEGEQVPEGKRSLALRLAFRAPDRTLTDAEVADVRAGIVAALDSIGATLRG